MKQIEYFIEYYRVLGKLLSKEAEFKIDFPPYQCSDNLIQSIGSLIVLPSVVPDNLQSSPGRTKGFDRVNIEGDWNNRRSFLDAISNARGNLIRHSTQ